MDKTITVRIDADTKKAAKSLADEDGVSLGVFVNTCLKQAIADRHLGINPPELISPKLEKILEKAKREIEAGEFIGPFDNAKDAIAALDKEIEE